MFQSKHQGFTLLELIIVVLIVGLTLTFISLSSAFQSDKEKKLQQAVMDFKSLLEYAEQQAITEYNEIGLVVSRNGYRFMRYQIDEKLNSATWVNIINDGTLTSYDLPSGTTLQFTAKSPSSNVPQIVLSSNGDITPFSMDFSVIGHAPSYRLVGEQNGEINFVTLGNRP